MSNQLRNIKLVVRGLGYTKAARKAWMGDPMGTQGAVIRRLFLESLLARRLWNFLNSI